MGTCTKIVDSLVRMSEEKKANLTNRYNEHSLWLRYYIFLYNIQTYLYHYNHYYY